MKARILKPTPTNLKRMAAHLRRGGIVAVPTETVYGLAANALDERACRAVFRAKRRPANDPLIVHVLDQAAAEELADWNEPARRLARKFWPGPLTIVLPKKPAVPGIVTSGGDSVAIRCPAHRVMRRLLKLAGVPIAAPSANPFGYVSPTCAEHVLDGLGGRIPFVIDGGPCPVGLESTIVDARNGGDFAVLRPGQIGETELRRLVRRGGSVVRRSHPAPIMPGTMERHYSPKTPLRLFENGELPPLEEIGGRCMLVRFVRPGGGRSTIPRSVLWLSDDGSIDSAANRLYSVLREIDHGDADEAQIERAPRSAGSLAAAINDRLERAAAGRGGRSPKKRN